MKKTYKKADIRKKNIMITAARCFKEYGYEKTTFQMLADELNISKAAIAYHYKIKPWIIYSLCENYMKNVYSYVKENMSEPFNYYKYYCTAHFYFFREVLRDERNRALVFHKDHTVLWEQECMYIIEGFFREIAADFKKESDAESIRAIAVMDFGAVLTLVKDFEKAPRGIDALCRNMLYLMGALINLDEATIRRATDYAFGFADSHPLPGISLLGI